MSPERYGDDPLPQIMSGLSRAGVTGTLSVQTRSVNRELLFVDGELRAARSSDEAEKLGSWLVQRGVITEQTKDLTLRSQESNVAPPLGHLLVSRGLTTEDELTRQLEDLALTIIERATAEPRVLCEFAEGATPGQPDTLPNATTAGLILFAARAFPDIQTKRSALGDSNQMVNRRETMDRVVQDFELTMPEKVLVGKLHRGRSIDELHTVSALPEHTFVSALYALRLAGVVTVGTDGVAGAASSAPVVPPPVPPSRGARPSRLRVVPEGSDPDAERRFIADHATRISSLNYYEMLGLDETATYQEVFDAWEQIERVYSPQRAHEPHLRDLRTQMASVFDLARAAFETLSSPERRPRYNATLRAPRGRADRPGRARFTSEAEQHQYVAEGLARADAMRESGDVFSAIKLLEELSELEQSPQILFKLAKLMFLNPHWANRALEKLRRAVEIDPEFTEGWLEVAEFWRRQKNRERQRKALERALAANPEHPKANEIYLSLVGRLAHESFLSRARVQRARKKG
jgi:hypothetical protein